MESQIRNFYQEINKDELLLELIPNEPVKVSIVIESNFLKTPYFVNIADFEFKKIKSHTTVQLELFENGFLQLEESQYFKKNNKIKDWENYYNLLKASFSGLCRDALLPSGSLDSTGGYMTRARLE